jgi:hypothetical protein
MTLDDEEWTSGLARFVDGTRLFHERKKELKGKRKHNTEMFDSTSIFKINIVKREIKIKVHLLFIFGTRIH